jgi:hypothetical protein
VDDEIYVDNTTGPTTQLPPRTRNLDPTTLITRFFISLALRATNEKKREREERNKRKIPSFFFGMTMNSDSGGGEI